MCPGEYGTFLWPSEDEQIEQRKVEMNYNVKRWLPILLVLILLIVIAVSVVTTSKPTEISPSESLERIEESVPPKDSPSVETMPASTSEPTAEVTEKSNGGIQEDGTYDGKAEVAEYIHLYGHLPSNYMTKEEARKLGWDGGSLEDYAPGMCIGGDYFGNYEKKLPTKNGRKYYECDIDTIGWRNRGSRRIIYSNDGLIFYTGDHYEHFEQLY